MIPSSVTREPIAVASAISVKDERKGLRVRFLNKKEMKSIVQEERSRSLTQISCWHECKADPDIEVSKSLSIR